MSCFYDYFYKYEGYYEDIIPFYILSFFTLGRFIGFPIFVMLSGCLLIIIKLFI